MTSPPNLSYLIGYVRAELAAAACALVLLAIPAQAGDVGSLGGMGGGEFRTACRPGDHLVGIDALEKNGVITRVAPICGNRQVSSTDTYGSPWAGSDDGARHQVVCPPDAVLTILHVFVDNTPLVSRIGFTCWNMKTNEMTNRAPDFGGVDSDSQRMICPQGQVGSGIYGRAGTAIDQLGLSCEPIAVAHVEEGGGGNGGGDGGGGAAPVVKGYIIQPVDVYDVPGGGGTILGFVPGGIFVDASENECQDGWCPISGPEVPQGYGWIFAEGFLEFRAM